MSTPQPRLAPLLALGLLAAAFAGCVGVDDADVLATFYPMTFLVEEIAGDTLRTAQILRPGTDPHHWEPSVRDVSRIAGSQLVIANGLEFETWLEGILASLGRDAPPVVWTAERIGPLPDVEHDPHHDDDEEDGHGEGHADEHDEHHEEDHHGEDDHGHAHGDADPHTWLDPVLMARKAAVVEEALATAFPEHAETFGANAAALLARLSALDEAFAMRLATCDTRELIVQHDAFAYLAARYDVHVHAASGIHPDAEPNIPTVARLIETAREHDLEVVFAEDAASPGVMRTIADEVGADVRILSPLEMRSPAETRDGLDYVDIMERNLDELARAMRCTSA